MSTAANIKNVRNMSGATYFRELSEPRASNVGHTQSASLTFDIEKEDLLSSITGIRQKYDTEVTLKGASGTLVLRETTARNIAFMTSGEKVVYTQDAVTDEIFSGTGAKKGEMIKLGYQNISDLSITGATEGDDYTLDAKAGVLEFISDFGDYGGVFSAPSIAAGEQRAMINILSKPEGITGELTVVQKQKRGGKRFTLVLPRVVIFGDGDLMVSKDESGAVTITLRFECIADPTLPEDKQFGYIEEVDV